MDSGSHRKQSPGSYVSGTRKPIPGTAKLAARRLPPYQCVWATCEPDSLYRAGDSRAFLMVPPGDYPASYSWPVSGHDVVLIGTGSTDRRIIETCRALLRDGATKVAIIQGLDWRQSRLSIVRAKAVKHAA